ncbi:SHOCT domain-containing protein [Luteimicrobium subarcticum]|uniref:Putative oligomerization/nucleic acid binding protein n=1 Tax=Luteimicrobium subarcticum TaxID=620910 RepID=A0A2M8WR43_9MICO|nr:putative oligomerization/nucleic acid binding protein [Luteimicrobium subarcticum]
MDFWNYFWLVVEMFFFVAYLFLLFYIISDLFRDRETNGWVKAIWIVFLIFIPFLTALVYILARGNGMAQRQQAAVVEAKQATDSYIRSVSGASPADQIAQAKELLDSGAIDQAEFEKLKASALR